MLGQDAPQARAQAPREGRRGDRAPDGGGGRQARRQGRVRRPRRSGAPSSRASCSSTRSTRSAAGSARAAAPTSRARACSATSCRIVEGTTVDDASYGPVRTDHVLFIAAGAFHVAQARATSSPSSRAASRSASQLDALTEADFVRILTEPKNALSSSTRRCSGTEGVGSTSPTTASARSPRIAAAANASQENIGARRLGTIFERVLEEVSFDRPRPLRHRRRRRRRLRPPPRRGADERRGPGEVRALSGQVRCGGDRPDEVGDDPIRSQSKNQHLRDELAQPVRPSTANVIFCSGSGRLRRTAPRASRRVRSQTISPTCERYGERYGGGIVLINFRRGERGLRAKLMKLIPAPYVRPAPYGGPASGARGYTPAPFFRRNAMRSSLRTHTCGALRRGDVGTTVTLCGWVNARRDQGGVVFVDLRDRHGLTQVTFRGRPRPRAARDRDVGQGRVGAARDRQGRARARRTPSTRTCRRARSRSRRPRSRCSRSARRRRSGRTTAPRRARDLRLEYRFIDLRRPKMTRILVERANILSTFRRHLEENGYLEVETPLLTRSTPGGVARLPRPVAPAPGDVLRPAAVAPAVQAAADGLGLRPLLPGRALPARRGHAGPTASPSSPRSTSRGRSSPRRTSSP